MSTATAASHEIDIEDVEQLTQSEAIPATWPSDDGAPCLDLAGEELTFLADLPDEVADRLLPLAQSCRAGARHLGAQRLGCFASAGVAKASGP